VLEAHGRHRAPEPSGSAEGLPADGRDRRGPYALLEEKMPGYARYAPGYLWPGGLERILGRMLVLLVWIGLIGGHFYVLEVRGRKSGRTVSLPVDRRDLEGRRHLVCARGNSNWCAMPAGRRSCTRPRAAPRPSCRARASSEPVSTGSQSLSRPFRRRGPGLPSHTEGIAGGSIQRAGAALPGTSQLVDGSPCRGGFRD
jgi:hypothetical protein